ncbi:hypothetical protein BJX63DRAFT_423685 [Aspergillus granulosus]|uniref:Uncharacterized protein n=1 Tax=Aspergillus granulosus TaxID=176169 RepID=A0ABR4H2E5_9EURO
MDTAALQCSICPKRPRFSDVSHLLTHVASKAHLSHHFKLQVRSYQEPQAEVLLDGYNEWYKANNLAKLLSDRMFPRDSHRKQSIGKNPLLDNIRHVERNEGYDVTPLQTCNPRSSLPDYIDPRLSDPFISSDIVTGNTQAPMLSPHDQQANVIANRCQQGDEDDFGNDKPSTLHTIPYWSRTSRPQEGREAQTIKRPFISNPFVENNDSLEYSDPGEMDKKRVYQIARLKGVLWPGMGIFDSATEQMKRKRNQKKDESILRMIEKTSMLWSQLNWSSPPLVFCANRHAVTDKKAKNLKQEEDAQDSNIDQHDLYTPVQELGCLGRRMPVGNDIEELVLVRHDHKFKPHNKFAVFRDIPTLREHKPEDQHTYLHGDAAASQPLFLPRDIPTPHPTIKASKIVRKASHSTAEKANMDPPLNVYGRLDPLYVGNSPSKPHGNPTGCSLNRLAVSLTNMEAENPIYVGEPGHALKAPSATQVSSPDSIIFEVEDDDFDRLYLDGSSS